ncbi:26S proteasome non-ATPase regulatory subunit 7-like protein A-like [Micractinium conductrix]|uniref:26S proteasome non-ATPase regulatory subunit 7-like protein A-like n=1 Tax=Micractinium conductrix TaxID=554055 RepID=A0A2P6V2R5_9CHLO|nr:26S proteasome non-ATPase regulatory subunit 7-like protein A-like [Micractinium conductrix]|eukprot:PSC68372.1 26S proteasome non-ATPase regulatory subunit 7-like protein A-like [Micractinium conductrix]
MEAAGTAAAAAARAKTPEQVVVHPLVLLSVVDHYNRVATDTRKRVVGVLLGESYKGRIDATNAFAVPFEEDDRDPSIWFLDHSYLETMFRMFKKVNARERVIGWYHTGPRLREADIDIHALLARYCDNPLLVICEVQPKEMGLPVHAYLARDEIREDGTEKSKKVFVNLPTEVGATEAEEIGVEHLLRDVKDASISTLSSEVGDMVTGLRGLRSRLLEIQEYLEAVVGGKLPVSHDIMRNLQDIFNLLPNLNASELSQSFAVESNDMMLALYLASLTRSVLALHDLIDNKAQRRYYEKERQTKDETAKAEKEKKEKEKESSKAAADGNAAPAAEGGSGEGKDGSAAKK